jgi:tight adherence protein B
MAMFRLETAIGNTGRKAQNGPFPNRDYSYYTMTVRETLVSFAMAAAVLSFIGFLFYQHVIACLVFAAAAALYPSIRRKQLVRNRKEQLRQQFKQALYSISSSLSAGKSVENAFREAAADLELLDPGRRSDILIELASINRRTENGVPIEKSLADFAVRSGVDEIAQFADAFAVCKRTGGNLAEVMRRTANIIGEKLEIEQEISVMVAQKRFEARALGVVPFLLIAFLAFASPDYMDPLYEGAGRIVMTLALGLLCLGHWLARKLMEIGV